jgi:hypothetical protein
MSNILEYNVDVNDISIHIVEMGKGKPVLFYMDSLNYGIHGDIK